MPPQTVSFYRLLLICGILFQALTCVSQDLIVRKDNTKLFCLIVGEDSVKLDYIKNNDKSKTTLSINKSEVATYYYADKENAKKLAKKTLEKRKYTEMTLAKGDTIYLNNEGDLEFRRTLITKAEALDLMQRNPDAYKNMKKANSILQGIAFISVISAPLIIFPFRLTGISIQDKLTFSGTVLVIACSVGIPLSISYKKHLKKAVVLFNNQYR